MEEHKKHWAVVEGIDGTGKTTLCKRLSEYYGTMGLNVKYEHFPQNEAAKTAVEFALEGFGPKHVWEFVEDMFDNSILFRPHAQYDLLLTDRWAWSIYAYCGSNLDGFGARRRADILEQVSTLLPDPDTMIFIRCDDVEECMRRKPSDVGGSFLREVNTHYMEMCKMYERGVCVLDSSTSMENMFSEATGYLDMSMKLDGIKQS